ncbi:MAG: dethiobiotin synthase [Actinobacteria bacterium]|nr:dethiobiotin synthase [Actinomycetota bacterium]
MTRPHQLLLITGTGTEIGKTWVGAALALALRESGSTVAARKPAQSFDPGDTMTDADVLAAATGEHPHAVCPAHRWYGVAMAPFMAAEALELSPLFLAELVAEIQWPPDQPVDVGLVEAAGGVRSPMTSDGGDAVDLAGLLAPDLVVLVADAGLGTINAVRLCLDALESHRVVVFLNRFDENSDLHRRNLAWLTANTQAAYATSVGQLPSLVVSQVRR